MTILSKIAKAHHRLRNASPLLDATAIPESELPLGRKHQHVYSLSINIESPPVILYGPESESSGYLLSGLLFLNIPHPQLPLEESPQLAPALRSHNLLLTSLIPTLLHPIRSNLSPRLSPRPSPTLAAMDSINSTVSAPSSLPRQVRVNNVTLKLIQVITYGKPFIPPNSVFSGCSECKKKVIILAQWDVLNQPTMFAPGKQAFPFSHLLPGSLPQTCVLGSSSSFQIRYMLIAESNGTYISFKLKKEKSIDVNVKVPIRISRSILKSTDRSSLRIFPPSNITVSAMIPNVIHPKSIFSVELKFNGLNADNKRWRLRKMAWRIEEQSQVRVHACDLSYHQAKLKVMESSLKLNKSHPNLTLILGTHVRKQNHSSASNAANLLIHNSSNTTASESDLHPTQTSASVAATQQEDIHDDSHDMHVDNNEDVDDHLAFDASSNSRFIHPQDHENQQSSPQQQSLPQENVAEDEEVPHGVCDLFIKDVRELCSGIIKGGWKSDFSNDGLIELAAEIDCSKLSTGLVNHISKVDSRYGNHSSPIDKSLDIGNDANCSCDIADLETGVYVSHLLIMEATLAEEALQPINSMGPSGAYSSLLNGIKKKYYSSPYVQPMPSNIDADATSSTTSTSSSNNSSRNSSTCGKPARNYTVVPTGLTRLFRMKFKLIFTERSGFGISWDEEVPPQYNQVSAFSPPSYGESLTFGEENLNELAELHI